MTFIKFSKSKLELKTYQCVVCIANWRRWKIANIYTSPCICIFMYLYLSGCCVHMQIEDAIGLHIAYTSPCRLCTNHIQIYFHASPLQIKTTQIQTAATAQINLWKCKLVRKFEKLAPSSQSGESFLATSTYWAAFHLYLSSHPLNPCSERLCQNFCPKLASFVLEHCYNVNQSATKDSLT